MAKRYEKRKDGFYYCLMCRMYRNLERDQIRKHVRVKGGWHEPAD